MIFCRLPSSAGVSMGRVGWTGSARFSSSPRNGGGMTFVLSCTLSNRIAAFGLVGDRFYLALVLLAVAGGADVISAVFRNAVQLRGLHTCTFVDLPFRAAMQTQLAAVLRTGKPRTAGCRRCPCASWAPRSESTPWPCTTTCPTSARSSRS